MDRYHTTHHECLALPDMQPSHALHPRKGAPSGGFDPASITARCILGISTSASTSTSTSAGTTASRRLPGGWSCRPGQHVIEHACEGLSQQRRPSCELGCAGSAVSVDTFAPRNASDGDAGALVGDKHIAQRQRLQKGAGKGM